MTQLVNIMIKNRYIWATTLCIATISCPQAYADTISKTSNSVTLNISSKSRSKAASNAAIDYVNATSLDLPTPFSIHDTQIDIINSFTSAASVFKGTPSGQPGFEGNGKQAPVDVGAPASSGNGRVTSMAFGTSAQPFTTSRADLSSATNTMYPYRATGKLFFNIGTATYVCSASLIKNGIIVTAAHCVANFGTGKFHTNWQFIPGYRNGVAPFGIWTATSATVLPSYLNGTDSCATRGVVCVDDVALIQIAPKATGPTYPGITTGYYAYGMDGYGFTTAGQTHITQLGYPVTLDSGAYMERTDSYGFKSVANSSNTIIGSNMGGGSSGGPWVVNFGYSPVLTGAGTPSASAANTVVGVTSWGYTNTAVMQQGASPFLSRNLGVLINTVCGSPTVTNARCL